ncbi:MAG: MBOAT family protein, partial [Verrucomicrobiia bacterium]
YHGVFLVLERTGFGPAVERLWRPLRHGYALLVVMVGWVLFRATTFPEAITILQNMAGFSSAAGAGQPMGRYLNQQVAWSVALGLLFSMPVWPGLRNVARRISDAAPGYLQVAAQTAGSVLEAVILVALLLVSAAWLAGGTYNPFIYFRF